MSIKQFGYETNNNWVYRTPIQAVERTQQTHRLQHWINTKTTRNGSHGGKLMNLLEYKDYSEFKKETGMQGKYAIEYLLDKLTELKKDDN